MLGVREVNESMEALERLQEFGLGRLELVAVYARQKYVKARFCRAWRDTTRTEKALFAKVTADAEFEEKIIELRKNVTEKAADQMKKMQGEVDNIEMKITVLRCVLAWKADVSAHRLLELNRFEMVQVRNRFKHDLDAY